MKNQSDTRRAKRYLRSANFWGFYLNENCNLYSNLAKRNLPRYGTIRRLAKRSAVIVDRTHMVAAGMRLLMPPSIYARGG